MLNPFERRDFDIKGVEMELFTSRKGFQVKLRLLFETRAQRPTFDDSKTPNMTNLAQIASIWTVTGQKDSFLHIMMKR